MAPVRTVGTNGMVRQQSEPWGRMDWLVDDALQPGAGLSLARMTLAPAAAAPGHRHPNCNEVIHVVDGSVELTIDGKRHRLDAGDTKFIPAGSAHGMRNAGADAAVMIVCYSAGCRVYEPLA